MIKTCKHCQKGGQVGCSIRRYRVNGHHVYLHDRCAEAYAVGRLPVHSPIRAAAWSR